MSLYVHPVDRTLRGHPEVDAWEAVHGDDLRFTRWSLGVEDLAVEGDQDAPRFRVFFIDKEGSLDPSLPVVTLPGRIEDVNDHTIAATIALLVLGQDRDALGAALRAIFPRELIGPMLERLGGH